jgi:hypothetical protein
MSMVIVTQNQYILATKVHSVTLDESRDWVEVKVDKHTVSVRDAMYTINITYAPDTASANSGRDEYRECSVTVHGKVQAYKLFKELINQIREQMPDVLFLNQALENLLNQDTLDMIGQEEINERKEEGARYDAFASKIRGVGKAKRKRKKVLRRSKKRNTRGRR